MYQTFKEYAAERLVDLLIMNDLLCTKPDGNMNMPEISSTVVDIMGE